MMDHKSPLQSISQIFADNLRRHIASFGSIAEFCRASGINRQQFNRYLAGQNLPNQATLERICKTLRLNEVVLFEVPQGRRAPGQNDASSGIAVLNQFAEGLGAPGLAALSRAAVTLRENSGNPSHFLPGIYAAYMPLANKQGHLVRTMIKVSHVGGLTVFLRRTSLRVIDKDPQRRTVGKHIGIVLADNQSAMFLGLNRVHPHEFTVMRFMHGMGDVSSVRIGLAMVRTPHGDIAARTVLEWIGNGKAAERRAMNECGVISLDDSSLKPEIASLFRLQPDADELSGFLRVNEAILADSQLTPSS